jgi:hypothetical protein
MAGYWNVPSSEELLYRASALIVSLHCNGYTKAEAALVNQKALFLRKQMTASVFIGHLDTAAALLVRTAKGRQS